MELYEFGVPVDIQLPPADAIHEAKHRLDRRAPPVAYRRVVLYLVRHGQTDANAQHRLLGRLDVALNRRGRAQASALASALPVPDRLVSSPLLRARETAAAFSCAVEVDTRWIELDYGALDGQPASVLAEPEWSASVPDTSFAPPGGESLRTLGQRVRSACTDLVGAARDGIVVVVTHVSPVKAAIAWALGADDGIAWRMYVEDAGVARIAIEASGPVLRSFNERFEPPP